MPFTDFGSLAIISLVLAFVSARTIYQTVRDRHRLFDDNFTHADRQQMSVVAFFVLIPISVFFHEVGHVLAVWYFGGEVLTFGYFLFFGFVEHRGHYAASDLFWIALWGNIVSVAMGLGALLWAFLRPMRAAFNYLLIAFGIISILISLVFYPLMDLLSDLHGDWSQIYTRDTPELAIGAGVAHALILLGGVMAWQSSRVRLRFASITGLRPEEIRKLSRRDAEREMLEAATAAAERFHGLARAEAGGSSRDAASARISWSSGGYHRTVIVIAVLTGRARIEIYGTIRALDGSNEIGEQRIQGIRGFPEPERLRPHIVQALEKVDTWSITQTSEASQH